MNDRLRPRDKPRPTSYGTENLPLIAHRPSIVAQPASSGSEAHDSAEARNGKELYWTLARRDRGARCRRYIGGCKAPCHGSHHRPDGRDVQPPQRSEVVTSEVATSEIVIPALLRR